MKLSSKIFILCFFLFTSLLLACGQSSDKASHDAGTGSYLANLIFPDDIPRLNDGSGAIDCAAAGISNLEFDFIINGNQEGTHTIACQDANMEISGVPEGKNITVEVFADDDDGVAILEGSEMIDIQRDQVNTGGEIQMQHISQVTPSPETPAPVPETPEPETPEPETPEPEIPAPAPDAERFTNDFGMEFIRIPAGTFVMGSPETELGRDESEIQHSVTLTQDYFMQVTEMTQAQWRAVVQAAGGATSLNPTPSYFDTCGDNCPVEEVSWDEVQQFITALNQLEPGANYALPTEAQWEYAARGGTTTALPDGDLTVTGCSSDPRLDLIAWHCGNSDRKTYPVQGKIPNTFGLYDMHGNVWEWCQDWYGHYSTAAQTDPAGPSTGSFRVNRGGSWLSSTEHCRSAFRLKYEPGDRYQILGFRLIIPIANK